MSKFLSALLLVLLSFGLLLNSAEAARFGGGRSFGAQRSFSSFSRLQQAPRMLPQSSSSSRWLAPLAGLAAGSLLAYLFMGHGLGSGLLTWLALLSVGLLLWNLLRHKLQPALSSNQNNQFRDNNVVDARAYFNRTHNNYAASNPSAPYPAGFDPAVFLREAKVQFIRMQAAYDAKDLNDLREFTAPEVFGEIQMQLQERGQDENKTEVLSLEAELLDLASEAEETLVSVKFSGMIREEINAPALAFKEAWHFKKTKYRGNWIVVGVQQNIN